MTMRYATAFAVIAIAASSLTTFQTGAQEGPRTKLLEGIDEKTSGPQLFMRAYEVFSHPRCSNCHPQNAGPPWWDIREGRVHGMNVQRGDEDEHGAYGRPGMECVTCHQHQNAALPGGPPGVARDEPPPGTTEAERPLRTRNWRLAPTGTGWGGMSPVDMCNKIVNQDFSKNPVAHIVVELDPLVAWAWEPGSGRESVPGNKEDFIQILKWWSDKPDKCPK